MSVLSNKDSTIYLAQQRLSEWGDIIATSSVRTSRVYQNKAERLRYYLKAIQHEQFLEESEVITLLQCINTLADLQEWPTAPLLAESNQPDILFGVPGDPGTPGAAGIDGTDADIDCIANPAYDNMVVTEDTVGGIKTYSFGYDPYVAPSLSVLVNGGTTVTEYGVTLSSIDVQISLVKGRDAAVSSRMVNPSGLDGAYQTVFNVNTLNSIGNQTILINDNNVANTTTYTAGLSDTKPEVTGSQTLTFVIPFLYGSSGTILTSANAYASLVASGGKLIQTKGDKNIAYDDESKYFYFGYPSSYGYLSEIYDGNGFKATGAFILLDASGDPGREGYNELPSILMASGSENMIVYRTKNITDIPGETYQFKF